MAWPGEQVDLVLDVADKYCGAWAGVVATVEAYNGPGARSSCFIHFDSATMTPLPTASSGVRISNTVFVVYEIAIVSKDQHTLR